MKTFTFFVTSLLLAVSHLEARDLTYKFGVGYRQAYTNAHVKDDGTFPSEQVSGLQLSYGAAQDLQLGGFFGFMPNFDFAMMGPTVRYNIQRLINRDSTIWNHLNLFVATAFLAKFGGESKGGITIHAPYLGIEILPFSTNNLAISTEAGLVIDFVKKNRVGFTQGLLGDLGIKYYF
jgi:hypothetical protein